MLIETEFSKGDDVKRDWRSRPYVGGFILSKSVQGIVDYFETFRISNELVFEYDPSKELTLEKDSDTFVLIYGLCVDAVGESKTTMAASLVEALSIGWLAFEEAMDTLCGRFLIVAGRIGEVYVYQDCVGARSAYYELDRGIVASHFRLLEKICQLPPEPSTEWRNFRMAMDLTPVRSIRQLLPNFKLDYRDMEVSRFYPRSSNRYSSMSHAERMVELEALWNGSLETLFALDRPVVLSVTGGADSRLTMAMTRNYWDRIVAFTYGVEEAGETNYSRVMNSDVRIVRKLLEHVHFREHRFLFLKDNSPVQPELHRILKENSTVSHGPMLVQRYRDEFGESGTIHIRSLAVETFRLHWGTDDSLDGIIRTCRFDGAKDFEWRVPKLGYGSDKFGFNGKDLLYWEIRLGKWATEVLNENDAAFETFMPHSCRRIFEIFLSYSEPQRSENFAARELINRNAPFLNFYGINSEKNLYESTRDERNRLLNRIDELEVACGNGGPTFRQSILQAGKTFPRAIGWRFGKLKRKFLQH